MSIKTLSSLAQTPNSVRGKTFKIKPVNFTPIVQSENKSSPTTKCVANNTSFCSKIKKAANLNEIKSKIQDSCYFLRNNVKITFKLIRIIVSIILFTISIFLFLLTVFQDKDIFQQIIHLFIENIEIKNSKNGKPI